MITKRKRGLFVGVTTMDLVYPFPGFPEENTKNKTDGLLIDIGGPATNAAFAFTVLGGEATLVSMVGQNPMSLFIKDRLQSTVFDTWILMRIIRETRKSPPSSSTSRMVPARWLRPNRSLTQLSALLRLIFPVLT